MGLRHLFSCFHGKIDPVVPGKLDVDDDQDNVVRSPACTRFNALGLRGTGYISSREDLHNALTKIFEENGSLNFGITVYQGCLLLLVRW